MDPVRTPYSPVRIRPRIRVAGPVQSAARDLEPETPPTTQLRLGEPVMIRRDPDVHTSLSDNLSVGPHDFWGYLTRAPRIGSKPERPRKLPVIRKLYRRRYLVEVFFHNLALSVKPPVRRAYVRTSNASRRMVSMLSNWISSFVSRSTSARRTSGSPKPNEQSARAAVSKEGGRAGAHFCSTGLRPLELPRVLSILERLLRCKWMRFSTCPRPKTCSA
jgi:hypothetical protein